MPRLRLTAITAAIAISAAAMVACGGSGDEDTGGMGEAPGGAEIAVAITSFAFEPEVTEVTPGDTVTWTNEDGIFHSATEGTGTPGGHFDGEMDGAGTTFSFVFEEPGTYEYYCSRHAFMQGSVVVSEG